ncbi:CinA family nicotinamide mononucleotide deamidase-related protein [Adhaeretor mobilis]|uniref:CinA-like protein n=1 Tax=Adhaeretor mobilis TaxID=1930276 RepID=A0A517MUK9_9BACT|nr:CinA family nicotinamide mononucleotide deamidase-related protein [Adhaeretor mobilis]QDS98571.1 Putative competence-damage inducible protein [Adhaeretor mobilis]
MLAEIIAIGDELITGQRLDTNTKWLSERLLECGSTVAFHTTVGDDLANNIDVFRIAIQRADIIVCTGGLGPTADDLTREVIAKAAGVPLVLDEDSLRHIENLYTSRGRKMPERNRLQAEFPAGASPIPNEHGTAPGIAMLVKRTGGGNCQLYALPGVPAELKPMWASSIAPEIIASQSEPRITVHRRLKCFGAGESHLEEMLPDLIARGRDPVVGITVSDATITLRATTSGPNEAACLEKIEPTLQIIRDSLGTLVYGQEDDELEHAVLRLLKEHQQTLSVAEWATGGLLSERLELADEEDHFVGGAVIRSLKQASSSLGVAAVLEPNSPQLAEALAEAIRLQTGADYGLAVSAFPPDRNAPEAHVFAAVASAEGTRKTRFACSSHPAIVRARTAKQAMNTLRLTLLGKVK